MAVVQRTAHEAKVHEALIDVDIHPYPSGKFADVMEYMSPSWQRRLEGQKDLALGTLAEPPARWPHPRGKHFLNPDARTPDGGPAASDPKFLAKDLLDRYGIDLGLLITMEPAAAAVASHQADHSAAVVGAYNDYMLDRWVADKRLKYNLVVTPLDLELAAAEVRKHGNNSAVAAVWLPLTPTRMGNSRFDPLYRAVSEFGLPIVIHPGTGEGIFDGAALYAGGRPEHFIENYCDLGPLAEAQISSLIANGTFERFKDLKVMFIEFGWAWAVSHLWRLDKGWHEFRAETPWVRRWPSEYFHDHIRLSTQPVLEPQNPRHLNTLIEDHLTDVLVYASDYPHWDGDRPGTVLHTLKEETKRKIFEQNARSILRL